MAEIGTPLPADLEKIAAGALLDAHDEATNQAHRERLHAYHADYDRQIAQLVEKKTRVRDTLTSLYAQRDRKNRAAFDLVISQGAAKFTLDQAKETMAMAAKGLFNLPAAMIDRLKKIVDSGKDEQ